MAGYTNETDYQSLAQALNDYHRVDQLKKMAKLICAEVPTRKAEIVEAISTAMVDGNLKTVFSRLSRIEQYAVAEAVHAPDGKIDFRQFGAK